MMTPESTGLTRMFVTTGFHVTRVFIILRVEDFTVYVNVLWGFQVSSFYAVGQNCSAESKDRRVSGEMLCGTVPHGEVHIVIGSFPSSRSYNPFCTFHSERGKATILRFVLVQGFTGLLSVELGILKEVQEYGTVFGVAKC